MGNKTETFCSISYTLYSVVMRNNRRRRLLLSPGFIDISFISFHREDPTSSSRCVCLDPRIDVISSKKPFAAWRAVFKMTFVCQQWHDYGVSSVAAFRWSDYTRAPSLEYITCPHRRFTDENVNIIRTYNITANRYRRCVYLRLLTLFLRHFFYRDFWGKYYKIWFLKFHLKNKFRSFFYTKSSFFFFW